MELKAVVIGAGWAGEGHAAALRVAGVDVVALCGRTAEPAYEKAKSLGIPNVRFDWRKAPDDFKPDIVAIAVPAAPHREIAETAARLGIHIVCEKPLAVNAEDARAMLKAVVSAGVKHGYGASSWYTPAVIHARALVQGGLIGHAREIESMLHFNYPALMAYSGWGHDVEQGGGMLSNAFTHKIAQVLRITQARVLAAAGQSRRLVDRAPVGPTFHDGGSFSSRPRSSIRKRRRLRNGGP